MGCGMKNLPTDLLRTFVSVAELGGFSKAGAQIGRSQPAVSLQIKRLEDIVDAELLSRNGRQLHVTEKGEMLLSYARQILKLNDQAMSSLTQPKVTGHIRLGIPNEFAISFLPGILGKFSNAHPEISLEVSCDLTTNLMQMLEDKNLDMVVAIHKPDDKLPSNTETWDEELVWVVSEDHTLQKDAPLPLVVAPEGCVYRNTIIHTLNNHHSPWRIVYSSTSYGGIRAAVMAGLGVTALARSTVPKGLKIISSGKGFPPLPSTFISLEYNRSSTSQALRHLIDYMLTQVASNSQVKIPEFLEVNASSIA